MFGSFNTTKPYNHILEANLCNFMMCRERLVVPQPTFCKPMMEV